MVLFCGMLACPCSYNRWKAQGSNLSRPLEGDRYVHTVRTPPISHPPRAPLQGKALSPPLLYLSKARQDSYISTLVTMPHTCLLQTWPVGCRAPYSTRTQEVAISGPFVDSKRDALVVVEEGPDDVAAARQLVVLPCREAVQPSPGIPELPSAPGGWEGLLWGEGLRGGVHSVFWGRGRRRHMVAWALGLALVGGVSASACRQSRMSGREAQVTEAIDRDAAGSGRICAGRRAGLGSAATQNFPPQRQLSRLGKHPLGVPKAGIAASLAVYLCAISQSKCTRH